MSVATVIVNYNAGSWLLKSVKSALQDTLITAVYVVDNASNDDSLDMLKEYVAQHASTDGIDAEKLNIVENAHNLGFGKANNQALLKLLERKEFEFVLLLNPDCELSPNVLSSMLPYFQKHPKLGMASCVINNSDGTIQSTCRRNFPTPWTAFLRMSQLQCFGVGKQYDFDLGAKPLPQSFVDVEAISGAFMLVRMTAVKEVGLFDEAYFMHCEDLDWCKRFAQKGWRVGFVPEVSVLHDKGVSSKARPIGVLWNLHQGMLIFFDKFYRDQYSMMFRTLVRIGIYISFLGRAGMSLLKGVVK